MTPVGGGMGLGAVLQMRAEILAKSQSLAPTTGAAAVPDGKAGGFGPVMKDALNAVHRLQSDSNAQSAAWERGETHDIASVMLSRQKASIAFDATLQARNRLLSAYRDVMNMPV